MLKTLVGIAMVALTICSLGSLWVYKKFLDNLERAVSGRPKARKVKNTTK